MEMGTEDMTQEPDITQAENALFDCLGKFAKIVNGHIEKILKLKEEYLSILSKELVLPFELPPYEISYNTMKEIESDILKKIQPVYMEFLLINKDGVRTVREQKQYIMLDEVLMDTVPGSEYGTQVMVVKLYVDGGRNDVHIPIACHHRRCRPVLSLRSLLRIAKVLQNEEFVKQLIQAMESVEKEYAESIKKLHAVLTTLKLMGFDAVNP